MNWTRLFTFVIVAVFVLFLTPAVNSDGVVPNYPAFATITSSSTPAVTPKVEPTRTYRQQDLLFEGKMYKRGELDSSPPFMKTKAHFFTTYDYNGRRLNPVTGCNRKFRPLEEMGVASWFYPCGTKLKVTNLNNNRSVYVTVMDRGPNTVVYPENKIDLYKKVFDELQGEGGEILVNIELLVITEESSGLLLDSTIDTFLRSEKS